MTTFRTIVFWFLWYSQIARLSDILFRNGAIVIAYHRVKYSADVSNQSGPSMWVSRELFEWQIRYLRKKFSIKPLRTVESGRSRGVVAITFDDGYREMKKVGAYLERKDIPYTLFVPGQIREKNKIFWWDLLWRGISQFLSDVNDFLEPHQQISDFERPEKSFESISARIRSGSVKFDEIHFIKFLQSKNDRTLLQPHHLSEREMRALSMNKKCEIGNHTHSHKSVVGQNPDVQNDFRKGHLFIESFTDRSHYAFSFPYGEERDITHALDKILKKSGYYCAVTLIPGQVSKSTDRYRIPRINVLNEPMFVFKTKLTPIYWWLYSIIR